MRRERLVPDVAAVQPRACGGHRKHTAALWVVHRRKCMQNIQENPPRYVSLITVRLYLFIICNLLVYQTWTALLINRERTVNDPDLDE